MFWRKQKKIKHLNEIVHLKEQERKMAHIQSGEVQKQLTEVLRENGRLKTKLARTEDALMKRIALVLELEAGLEEAELTRIAAEKDAREKRGKTYKACAKMRETIRSQAEELAIYRHNMDTLMSGYERIDRSNIGLNALCREQAGKLEVYTRFLGKLSDEKSESEGGTAP